MFETLAHPNKTRFAAFTRCASCQSLRNGFFYLEIAMDQAKVLAELDRLSDQAVRNGLPLNISLTFASGMLHEQLAAIVRAWQDRKTDEAAASEAVPA